MASGSGPPSKKIRAFNNQWRSDPAFKSWLIIDEDPNDSGNKSSPKMLCSVCKKAGLKNIFTVQGCQEYQRSALTRHMGSNGHQNSIQILKSREAFKVARSAQESKAQDNLELQMKTAYFIVEKGLPISLFEDLIELQKSNGAPNLTSTYKSHEAVSDMIESLAWSLDEKLKTDIDKCNFIGIMTDESIDIAVLKKLVIYVKIVQSGKSGVYFATNLSVPDGKAETIVTHITQWLLQQEIPVHKILGLGSDGAAVMLGKRSGVGVRFKQLTHNLIVHVHCYAHRLALAISQAATNVNLISNYQDTVNSVYWYFSNSAQRYNRLREVYDILEDDRFITLKQPHAVRWLSLDQAVYAINNCWPALVMTLEQEAATGNATARGLSAKVHKYDFIAATALLVDILPNFTRLSKVFQRDSLDFSSATTAIETTKATLNTMLDDNQLEHSLPALYELGQAVNVNDRYRDTQIKYIDQGKGAINTAKNQFLRAILSNLDDRFPEDSQKILKAFDKLLNPKQIPADNAAIGAYGRDQLDILLEYYAPPGDQNDQAAQPHPMAQHLNVQRCRQDFLAFKHFIFLHRNLSFAEFCELLIQTMNDIYPDFSIFAQIALIIPLNSASCERGFSAQNKLKSKARNRLHDQQLDRLMRITINGPHFAEFDYTAAKAKFRGMKNRLY